MIHLRFAICHLRNRPHNPLDPPFAAAIARLSLEQERLEREREKTEEEVFEQFHRWARNSKVRDCLCENWHSPEERERHLREIYGLEPKSPEEEAADKERRIRETYRRKPKTPEEVAADQRRRIREIYGLPPEPPEEPAPDTPESNSVKPGQTRSNQKTQPTPHTHAKDA
ncbi:MAG: hypothetical protein ABSE16_04340 [Verrucomicrobiota bacterium]